HKRQRTDGAERLVLKDILNLKTQARAVSKEGADQLAKMTDAKRDAAEAMIAQVAEDDFQDRPIANRHQRFRQHRRVRAQAHALAAAQDDRARVDRGIRCWWRHAAP